MNVALEIKSLSKTFSNAKKKDNLVLNNISFDIKEGEIFGLVGLNGIGKTTIIKSILNLINIDSGEIKIFGIDKNNSRSRKNICYLPEKFYPSQYLTGYEFLKYSLSFYNKNLNKKEAEEMAERLDLNPLALKQVIKKYSKGMGQKLGIIACLLTNASLLILDEPMTGLDPKARVLLKNTLKDYVKKKKTIFFSSHILEDIEEICDSMAVLHNGALKFQGTPNEFMGKYQHTSMEKSFLECIDKN